MNFSKKNHEHIKAIKIAVSKTQLKTIGLLLLILGIISSCTKSDDHDQLPPITQTGANTFGCVIDGKVFIPKDHLGYTPPGGGTPKGISVLRGASYFSITASNYVYVYIYIYIPKHLPEATTYTFKISDGEIASGDYPHCLGIINSRNYLSYENSGTITFTKIDETQGIIAGTFTLKMKNKNDKNDIIEISEGRFDI